MLRSLPTAVDGPTSWITEPCKWNLSTWHSWIHIVDHVGCPHLFFPPQKEKKRKEKELVDLFRLETKGHDRQLLNSLDGWKWSGGLIFLNTNIGHQKQDWLCQRTVAKVTWNPTCLEMDNVWSSPGFCDRTGTQTCCLYKISKSGWLSFALHHVMWPTWLLIREVNFSSSCLWTKGHDHERSWKYLFLTTLDLYTKYPNQWGCYRFPKCALIRRMPNLLRAHFFTE